VDTVLFVVMYRPRAKTFTKSIRLPKTNTFAFILSAILAILVILVVFNNPLTSRAFRRATSGLAEIGDSLIRNTQAPPALPATRQPSVHVLNQSSFTKPDGIHDDLLLKFNCTTGVLNATIKFPVCTYTVHDDRLSAVLINGGYDEHVYVHLMLGVLQKDPQFQFVDLGSNLGIYSLPAAHLGRTVLAVEANAATAKLLAKSVYTGKIQDRMTVVFNALSNGHEKLRLGTDLGNRANSWLLQANNCSGVDETAITSVAHGCVNVVDTITLDDLLPLMKSDRAIMKVDIQGAEARVFNDKTASKFFDAIQVPFIQLEFGFYTKLYTEDPAKREQVDTFLRFFTSRNYTVHPPGSSGLLGSDWRHWPYDIVFKKPYRILAYV